MGLLRELRPLTLLTTLTCVFLAVLFADGIFSFEITILFVSLLFCLYAVHALDTYEDEFIRKEDRFKSFTFAHGATGLLTKNELAAISIISSAFALVGFAYLAVNAGAILFPILFAAWAIGVSYSRILSRNLLAGLLAYPSGVMLAMSGAFIVANGNDWNSFAALLGPVFLILLGVKTWMDTADSETDSRTGRPNISNVFGIPGAKGLSIGFLMLGTLLALLNSFTIYRAGASILFLILFLWPLNQTPQKGISIVAPAAYLFLLMEAIFHGALIP